MATWLDPVIAQLKSAGTADALAFVESNYSTLLPLGLDSVTDILALLKAGQNQQAIITLESRLCDPDVIIAYELQTAEVCTAREKAIESFKAGLKSFALELLPVLVKVASTVASGGLALCLALCLMLSGCSWQNPFSNPAGPTTEQANILSGGYMRVLDKTTPEQDKAHIRSMDAEILAVDGAVRGTQAASSTRSLVSPSQAALTPNSKGGVK